MEIGEYLAALRKRWYVIVVLAVLGAGIGYQQAQASTPMYRSTAKVFVSLARGDTMADLVQGSTYTRNLVESYVQLTTVPAVLEPVIAELGLHRHGQALAVDVTPRPPWTRCSSRSPQRAGPPNERRDVANAVADRCRRPWSRCPRPRRTASRASRSRWSARPRPQRHRSPPTQAARGDGRCLGLAIGLAIALAWARLDTKVRGTADLPREPARPLLGLIPYDRSISTEGPRTIIEHPRGALAEAYRRVRPT